MERNEAGTKERNADCQSLPNQNTMLINIMVLFYKIWKKYNEIQLTKNKMDLNNRTMNHPPPRFQFSVAIKK